MTSIYHYTECGLDNIWVHGVMIETDEEGMECYTIPHIRALHKAIAREIVAAPGMSGAELRFLRTEMGMYQTDMAKLLHKTALTISRWERDEKPIDPNAMAIIRLQAIERLKIDTSDSIEVLMKKSERVAPPPDMCFNPENNHYVRIAA